jgi:hypothetical protein
MKRAFSWPELGVQFIRKQLLELGVELTESQMQRLRHELESESVGDVLLNLDERQEEQLRAAHDGSTSLEIDFAQLAGVLERPERLIEEAVRELVDTVSEHLVEAWKTEARELLEQQREQRALFNDSLRDAWGRPVQLLDILVSTTVDKAAAFNRESQPRAVESEDHVFDVLTSLHARGCQVALEILTLLENGLADGAHARWRTLHELAVVAMFIKERGQRAAKRYLAHRGITAWYDAANYQEHCQVLGYPPMDDEEFEDLASRRAALLQSYGDEFDEWYGWAAHEIKKSGRVTFTDIERAVDLNHFRPFYRLANINVHAGSGGARFRLGLPEGGPNALLAGSSLYGLADPGQNTAISLHQLTTALLLVRPSLDNLVFLGAQSQLVDETCNAFVEVHRKLQRGPGQRAE